MIDFSDPVVIAATVVGGIVFVVIPFFYFLVNRQENTFEQWYGPQRLLDEEEEKRKKKAAGGKKKEKKSDAQAKAQKDEGVKSEKSAAENTKQEEVKEDAEEKTKKKNKKGSLTGSEQSKDTTPSPEAKKAGDKKPEQSKPAKKAEKPVQVPRERSPVKVAEPEFVEVKSKQQKKRASPETVAQLAKPAPAPVVEEVKKEEIVPVKTAAATPSPVQPALPIRRIDEMDMGKLLADMVTTLGPVHVQFLKNYVDNVNKKEKTNALEASKVNSEKNELLKQIQSQTGKIRSLEEAIAHHQTEKTGFNDHVNQLVQKEKQLLAELEKQGKEFATLRGQAETGTKAAEQAHQQLVELGKKLAAATADVATYMNKAQELEKQLLKAREDVPPPQEDKSAQLAALEQEKKDLLQKHFAEKAEWEEKHSQLMEEYVAIQQLCEQLKFEVQNFEQWKGELESSTKEVDAQKKEIAKIRLAHEELQNENKALRSQIEGLNKQVSARPVQNGDLGEEIIIQKSHTLTSAPPGLETPENKLREENQRLKEKNEELRSRNFKLQEMFENHTTATSSKPAAETKTETKKDSKKKDTKKEESKSNDAPATEPPLVKSYRDALVAVKSELTRISDLADQQQKTIHKLEAQVKSSQQTPSAHKVAAAAVALPASDASKAPAASKKMSSAGSDKSGEENDWELVY